MLKRVRVCVSVASGCAAPGCVRRCASSHNGQRNGLIKQLRRLTPSLPPLLQATHFRHFVYFLRMKRRFFEIFVRRIFVTGRSRLIFTL